MRIADPSLVREPLPDCAVLIDSKQQSSSSEGMCRVGQRDMRHGVRRLTLMQHAADYRWVLLDEPEQALLANRARVLERLRRRRWADCVARPEVYGSAHRQCTASA
jgi:hypothetical protein